MQRQIKIVHTSDVHLDSRGSDAAVEGFRSRAECAFSAVVDLALREDADLLLVAGDLFDNNRVDDSNIHFVYHQFARLRPGKCQVVMLPGNHDVHDATSVWNRFDFDAAGAHVHGLMAHGGTIVELDELGVTVWGKAMFEHAPENYPLDGSPDRHDSHWYVGMAHGQVVDERVDQGSSPITREEIGTSGFDYLALGHIHVWADHSEGSTKAYYCGSPVAHYAGAAGGMVAVVTLCPEAGVEVSGHQVTSWDAKDKDETRGYGNGFPW